MSARRRVGVLGTYVHDRIWTPADVAAGRPFETWGGVMYSLAAASAFAPDGWEVVPVARVGADLADDARARTAALPRVVVDHRFLVVPEPNNRVELTYTDAHRRGERLTGGVEPWTWTELAPRLDGLDALYVNFLSGYEMDLETAERLRAAFAGPTWCDLHSLFLGCPGAGVRQPRHLPDAARWLACWDAVQTNEDELALLGRPHPSALLADGPALAVTTRGPDGAMWGVAADLPPDPLTWPSRRGRPVDEVRTGDAPPPSPSGGDPTGAGDVWGAVAFLSLLGGATVAGAVARANAAAHAKLSVRGASDLRPHLAAARDAPGG